VADIAAPNIAKNIGKYKKMPTLKLKQKISKIKNAKTNSSSEKMLFEWIKNNEISFSEFQILLKIKECENELN
jgi:hypothetical protein